MKSNQTYNKLVMNNLYLEFLLIIIKSFLLMKEVLSPEEKIISYLL